MKKAIFTVLALSVLCTPLALASGSSGTVVQAPEVNPLTITETIKCVVTDIQEDGTVLVKDSEENPAHVLPFHKKTKIVAQDKKAFGKKKLDVADLEVGHVLNVTVRPATGEVVRVKVLKES